MKSIFELRKALQGGVWRGGRGQKRSFNGLKMFFKGLKTLSNGLKTLFNWFQTLFKGCKNPVVEGARQWVWLTSLMIKPQIGHYDFYGLNKCVLIFFLIQSVIPDASKYSIYQFISYGIEY